MSVAARERGQVSRGAHDALAERGPGIGAGGAVRHLRVFTNEVATTWVTASSTSWERFSVMLHVANPGFTDLRFQVYSYTATANLDMDGDLTDVGIPTRLREWDERGSKSPGNGLRRLQQQLRV